MLTALIAGWQAFLARWYYPQPTRTEAMRAIILNGKRR